ncbi:hypothetical protein DL764_006365 [Monosporascus ibericus]|uniref:Uncharacterized protein n=1 Tax=Monosporascus ibericus TaxID=155417 RepID=A0A4V1XA40_9PEZI|nr:hypothetical protein DL764_006365 [Monosporascus ibericus]
MAVDRFLLHLDTHSFIWAARHTHGPVDTAFESRMVFPDDGEQRNWQWHSCLAAALVLPAIAAVHSIVLTAVHVNGAVDMDVYGAFQLCSIGVLAAPVTVQFSRTYFFDPARNLIFLWSSLLFIGLVCLTIEFFRITPVECTHDEFNNPVFSNAKNFSYNTTCRLTCSEDLGPYSPLRRASTSNIYVIPSPFYLPFGTGVLLAAACCIPTVLSLVSMWNKIVEINWKKNSTPEADDKSIEGTNGATIREMKGVNSVIRKFLSVIAVPMYGAGVLALVIIGELNFWSSPVKYQTEPITGIGQWGPIVGTALAALGSLYVFLATDLNTLQDPRTGGAAEGLLIEATSPSIASPRFSYTRPRSIISQNGGSGDHMSMNSQFGPDADFRRQQTWVSRDAGSRRKVARSLLKINSYFETASLERFDDSGFKQGEAGLGFPEVPAEGYRNPTLRRAKEEYKQNREAENREAENALPDLSRQHSQADSFARSASSGFGGEHSSAARTGLAQKPRSSRSASPVSDRGHRSSTGTTNTNSSGRGNHPSISDVFGASGQRLRSDTLEVPKPTHHNHARNSGSTSSSAPVSNLAEVHSSPAIVLSFDAGPTSSNNTPASNEPSTGSSSEHAGAKPRSLWTWRMKRAGKNIALPLNNSTARCLNK